MAVSPLGPLVEKSRDLYDAGANIAAAKVAASVTASKEFGGMLLGAAVDFTKETTISAGDKGLEAVGAAKHLGHSALSAVVDVSKVGLSLPGATVHKIEEAGEALIDFSKGLLPTLGDRPKDKE